MVTSKRVYCFYSDFITEMNKFDIILHKQKNIKYIIRWIIALEQSKTNYLLANPEQLLEGSVFANRIEENGDKPKPERGYNSFLSELLFFSIDI